MAGMFLEDSAHVMEGVNSHIQVAGFAVGGI